MKQEQAGGTRNKGRQTTSVSNGVDADFGEGEVSVVDEACLGRRAGAVHEAVREEPEPALLGGLAADLPERAVADVEAVGAHDGLEDVGRTARERVADRAELLPVALLAHLRVDGGRVRLEALHEPARLGAVGVARERAVAVLLEEQAVAQQPLHRRDQEHREVPAVALRVRLHLPRERLEAPAPARLGVQRLHRLRVALNVPPVRLKHVSTL